MASERKPLICDDARNADRPLAINETKMSLEPSLTAHSQLLSAHLRRSEEVVRGGVEPPTFRFSGAGTTVQARLYGSFAVLSAGPWPAIDPIALR